jgi:hypothetical protein
MNNSTEVAMKSRWSVRGAKWSDVRGAVVLLAPLLAACAAEDVEHSTGAEKAGAVGSLVVPGCCSGPASEPAINGLRLTVSANDPVPGYDTSGTNVYVAPYTSSSIALYDGSAWISRVANPLPSVAVPTALNTNYDVYAYWDGSGVALELASWASPKTRVDGVLTKSGDVSRRFLGSVGTSYYGAVVDSTQSRLVWNEDNQVPRPVSVAYPNVWYLPGTNAWRDVGGSTTARVDVLAGSEANRPSTFVSVRANQSCSVSAPASAAGFIASGIGIDSSTATSSQVNPIAYTTTSLPVVAYGFYDGYLSSGRHTLRWLENGMSGVTFYCYGATSGPPFGKSAMSGFVTM